MEDDFIILRTVPLCSKTFLKTRQGVTYGLTYGEKITDGDLKLKTKKVVYDTLKLRSEAFKH